MNRKWGVFLIAIFLIFAFGFHAVSFDHHHPWDAVGGDRVQAALHGDNKKWLVDAVCVLALCTGLMAAEFFFRSAGFRRLHVFAEAKLFDPQRIALRSGIMHPKLCA
ncbi:MAG: hypothetical protein Q8R30_05445 [bacterium]|nr:hypothetical protein [bacterium]MDZ4285816.1 hypothetical protein [Candidatus Sungbacteria bacterium]